MTLAQQLKSMSLPGTPAYRAAEAMEAAEVELSAVVSRDNNRMYASDRPIIWVDRVALDTALAKLRGEA